MENEYTLISKIDLKKLKDENKKLKLELNSSKKEEIKQKNSKKNIEKTQNPSIEKELKDIKELNKKVLDLLLNKTDKSENKIDTLIETFKQLIDNISLLTSEIESSNNLEIQKQLNEIEKFQKKLQTMLSHVKTIE